MVSGKIPTDRLIRAHKITKDLSATVHISYARSKLNPRQIHGEHRKKPSLCTRKEGNRKSGEVRLDEREGACRKIKEEERGRGKLGGEVEREGMVKAGKQNKRKG